MAWKRTCLQKQQGLPKLLQAGGFASGKLQKKVLLEAISWHVEEKNVTGKSQHGFTKGNQEEQVVESLSLVVFKI